MKRRSVLGVLLAMTMVAAMLTGCGNGTKTTATTANETKKTETVAETKSAEVTQVELPEMATPNEWVSRFDGVKPTAYEEFGWTDDQITSIKDAGLTVGLVMHTGGESFSNAVISGVTKAAEELGVEIVAQTDAQWDAAQQSTNLESVLAKNPDIVILCQIDVEAMTDQLKEAAANGTKFVFFDNINASLTEDDYVSLVTTDTYAAGVECAKDMAAELGGSGRIAMFTWSAPNLGNRARSQGFRDYIETNFPEIEIVTEEFYDDASDCAALADAVFAKYPDLDGAFGQWDIPLEGVISSAQGNDIGEEFVGTCVDLGYNVARIMAEDGMCKGIGAQQPYKDGYYSLYAGALACVGEEVPKMILIDPVNVTKANLEESWPIIYDEPLPDDIQSLLK
ncbi:substrate-binding domain-containing protein [Frisingicoccus sp.]|uniref:substrate-binding domain-containing protein n=1 Tax=Frisingicoccus sp. TaxID=1918627 RepID=UPI0015B9E4DC